MPALGLPCHHPCLLTRLLPGIRAYTRAYRHADCQAGVPTNRGLSVEEDTTMAESLWPLVNPVTVTGLSSTCRTQGIRRLDFRVKVTLRQM